MSVATEPACPIRSLDVSSYRIPLDAPESDGTLTWDHTDILVVEAEAEDHRSLGYSYAGPWAASVVRDVLERKVVGRDARDVAGAWTAMVAAIRNHGRAGIVSTAIAAVDIALWDLKARLLGEPLCRVVGMARDRVPIYGSGGFTSFTEQELVDQLGEWVDRQGIPRVKMKVGTSWGTEERHDIARASRVRDGIGDGAELFVDANGGYDRKQAARVGRAFEDAGVTWFEEPVSSDDLRGLHELRAMTTADIAAGEYGYDLVYFEHMCAAGAVDCLQADVSRCGGITEWLRVAAVAAAHGLELSGHCAPSLHVHPACTIPNLRHVEYFADHVRADRLLFDGVLVPQEGGVLIPDLQRPGLGLELRCPDAERFRCA